METIFRNRTTELALLEFYDESGQKIDISGYTFYFAISRREGDGTPLLEKTFFASSPTEGEALLTLSASETDLELGEFFAEIAFENSENEIFQLASFKIQIREILMKNL